ncbi:MAG: S46 family peptidase [Myxococcaceae bacterium]|nr:S46 family peptidase [Myxococcaceae bacterium]MCI0671045.1 S46 family peptidase [Myxococcaceae bacterium]
MRRLLLGLVVVLATPALAVDGKWTPQQVLELDPAWLKQLGLKLPPSRLWDPERGTGLLAGTVSVGGCSGSFISDSGLVITNHHCAYGIIQEHSTPSNDLLTNGFLARRRDEELAGKGVRVKVPRRFTDVTREVLAAIPEGADDRARFQAIDRKEKELVARCEQKPDTRCQVSVFDGGVQWTLIESTEFQDVRLVYAPPGGVGNYGGETDNWMWPRHTGDFAIVRVYTGPDGKPAPAAPANVPHKPEFFFPLSTKGVSPGDFVMVLGYPGSTVRALLAEEMAARAERLLPRTVDVYGEYIRLLESTTTKDSAGAIAVASDLKGLQNRYKNAQGQLVGLARGRIVEKQRAAEEAVVRFVQGRADLKGAALAARESLRSRAARDAETFERDFLLDTARRGVGAKGLALSTIVARMALAQEKPDMERDPMLMDRKRPELMDMLERQQKNYFAPADRALFAAFVRRALVLPEGSRIPAIDRAFGARSTAAQVEAKVAALYKRSKVLSATERRKMAGETPAQLRARKDPLVDLGLALATDLEALRDAEERKAGEAYRLRPAWRRAVLAHAGKPVAPDANSTLRVTFAHVQGYRQRDGLMALPQTTLSGILEKHTGEKPFDVPEKLRETARAGKLGRWVDPGLKDVPVAFLADADTTGGNSGSPTVDAEGRLVGVNFDRVWENVANDFGFNPEVARNISVDVRYVLWLLDQVEDADALLRELGVRTGAPTAGSGAH